MNKNIVLVGLILLVIFVTGCSTKMISEKPAACTQEAKICPDGTAVGRTGPNCEFASCSQLKNIVVKQSGGAAMLIRECSDREYISNFSDYIIEGIVEKAESRWNDDHTSIITYTDFAIDKYVKGAPFAEDKLQIQTPGGTVGNISMAVEDQPIFHEGKKVRIYFKEDGGIFSIVCAQMGVEEI